MTDRTTPQPGPLLTLVVAAAENDVIGRGGKLPWRIPSDLRLFRRLTMGKPVVMGRKTFEAIGKPLDGRDNIVISRDPGFGAGGITVKPTLAEALDEARMIAVAKGVCEVMVIGGAEVFRQVLPHAGRIYLTRVHGTPEGDVHLPPIPLDQWLKTASEALPRGDADEFACTLITLERKRQVDGLVTLKG